MEAPVFSIYIFRMEGRKHRDTTPPTSCPRPDVIPRPSAPLCGFLYPRAKLDGEPFHPPLGTSCCQDAVPSNVAAAGRGERFAELRMAVLPWRLGGSPAELR